MKKILKFIILKSTQMATNYHLVNDKDILDEKYFDATRIYFENPNKLPDNLKECENLKNITIFYGTIENLIIPETVVELKLESYQGDISVSENLETLFISESDCNVVISQNNKLKTLYIYESFNEFPEFIRDCKQLQSLTLSINEDITIIPDWICELTQLETINMAGCTVYNIPESVKTLKNLSVFEIYTDTIIDNNVISYYRNNIKNFPLVD